MWYNIPEEICEDTQIFKKSNQIENYLNLIDTADKIKLKEIKTCYEVLVKNSGRKNTIALKKFHELIVVDGKKLSFRNSILNIKEVIKNNLNLRRAFKETNFLISYNELELPIEQKKIIDEFCEFLWKKYYSKEEIDEYVNKFIENIHPNKKCPFCGINTLSSTKYKTKRSPIDHYFPKSKYPFLSFYKKNLIVMCERCNSHKSSKIMELKVINPYEKQELALKLESYSLIENNYNFIIIPEDKDYESEWNKIFKIKSVILEEASEKIESYEECFKDYSYLELEKYIKNLKYNLSIVDLAYFNYKIQKLKKLKNLQNDNN